MGIYIIWCKILLKDIYTYVYIYGVEIYGLGFKGTVGVSQVKKE